MINLLTTGEIRHAVNVAAMDPKTLDDLRGYLDVAYRLGSMASQLHSGGIKSCKLDYRGDVTSKDIDILTAAFCAGLLDKVLDQEANIINSEVLLKERGVKLTTECCSEMGSFSSSITATISDGTKDSSISGTLFGKNMPRLILLNGQRLEAYLDGILCVFSHNDVPGIIGRIGTIFGNHQVNIAQMAVGRSTLEPGGTAVGVLNLDALPAEAAIEELLACPDVTGAQVIELSKAGELPSWLQ